MKTNCITYIIILVLPICLVAEIARISAGAGHSLLLKDDGTVFAWGANDYGQLGTGNEIESSVPVQVHDMPGTGYLQDITDISAGFGFSLALAADSTVFSWGANDYGQLGDGTTLSSDLPVQVLDSTGANPLENIVAISAGSFGCLALDDHGRIWSWGSNREGALGRGDSDFDAHKFAYPVRLESGGYLDSAIAISCGSLFNYAILSDSTILAWGANGDGQLGNDTTLSSYFPEPVLDSTGTGAMRSITSVVTTGTGVFGMFGHGLAMDSHGKLWAVGRNYNGQLGDGTTISKDLPVRVKNSTGSEFIDDVHKFAAGSEHSLVLLEDGSVWAWGNNYYGVIGENTTTDKHLPTRVHGVDNIGYLPDIEQIATSHSHNLAMDSEGSLYAWGRNDNGQLGDGTTEQRNYPVEVTSIPVRVPETPPKPKLLQVHIFPNPFNSAVSIECNKMSRIEIFDISGRKIESSRDYVFAWNPDEKVPAGLYLIRVRYGDESLNARVIYLK